MSHTNFLYHIVFATKRRAPLIKPEWEARLHKELASTTNKLGGLSIEVNGVEDHVHMLSRFGPTRAFSDLMRDLKSRTSGFVRRRLSPDLAWQRKYGAFTVSESVAERVRHYIRNQKNHHRKQSLEDEYRSLLKKHGVDFNDNFLWD